MAYIPQGDSCGAYPGPYVPPLFFRLEHKTSIYLPRNSREHTHTVILLHDRGYTLEEYGLKLFEAKASGGCNLPQVFPNVKWILPTFAVRRSQKESNIDMTKWFDMWRVEDSRDREQMQRTGLRESVAFIRQLVEVVELVPSVPAENIVLGGVGQGGATAMHTLFAMGLRLGGFIGLSSWMPLIEELHAVVARIMNKEKTATSLMLEAIWALAPPSSEAWDEKTKITAHVESAGRTPFFLAYSNNDKNARVGHRQRLRQCLSSITKESSVTMYQSGEQWVVKTCEVDGVVDFIKKVIASSPKKKEVAKPQNWPKKELSSSAVEGRSWSEAGEELAKLAGVIKQRRRRIKLERIRGETLVNSPASSREASETQS
jgi:lysophospholipase-2